MGLTTTPKYGLHIDFNDQNAIQSIQGFSSFVIQKDNKR